jgi:hypothetical protein
MYSEPQHAIASIAVILELHLVDELDQSDHPPLAVLDRRE